VSIIYYVCVAIYTFILVGVYCMRRIAGCHQLPCCTLLWVTSMSTDSMINTSMGALLAYGWPIVSPHLPTDTSICEHEKGVFAATCKSSIAWGLLLSMHIYHMMRFCSLISFNSTRVRAQVSVPHSVLESHAYRLALTLLESTHPATTCDYIS
jgi:hypothetical protein